MLNYAKLLDPALRSFPLKKSWKGLSTRVWWSCLTSTGRFWNFWSRDTIHTLSEGFPNEHTQSRITNREPTNPSSRIHGCTSNNWLISSNFPYVQEHVICSKVLTRRSKKSLSSALFAVSKHSKRATWRVEVSWIKKPLDVKGLRTLLLRHSDVLRHTFHIFSYLHLAVSVRIPWESVI